MKLQTSRNHLPADYAGLLSRVKKTLIEGQQRIESERVRTYWETGRVIHADILKHKDRAEYGAEILTRLAEDLDVELSTFQRCVKFYRTYPKLPISGGRPKFTWTHYRKLITIADDKKRTSLERAVVENDWSADELAARIKKDSRFTASEIRDTNDEIRDTSDEIRKSSRKPLIPSRGVLYTYQLVKRPSLNPEGTELLVDLGFGVFRNVEGKLLSGFSNGDIVEAKPKEDAYRFVKTNRTAKDLYTYAAYIEKVIDGDTLKVRFDLGFDTWVRETLRLRGLDCPEMDTKEGQAAKAFVQSYIKEADTVIVRSSRSDKYDRYLADVFIPTIHEIRNTKYEIRNADDVFLNNLLLEQGHATRMTD